MCVCDLFDHVFITLFIKFVLSLFTVVTSKIPKVQEKRKRKAVTIYQTTNTER